MSDPSIFDIHQWNAMILPKNNAPNPVLYVVPNDDLLTLLFNTQQVNVQITQSNSIYDNIVLRANVDPSSLVGGYRPNFQSETGYIALVLLTQWQGYPQQTGTVKILDMETQVNNLNPTNHIEENFSDKNSSYVVPISLFLVALGIGLLYY